MTHILTRLPALATLAVFTAGLMALPASAQTPQTATPPAEATTAAEASPPLVDLYTDDDEQASLDARIIALRTVIRLTPEQEKLWPPFEAALRQAAKNATGRAQGRAKAEPADDFLDVLERLAGAEAARAADVKSVVAAAKPLVAVLTVEQQRRIPGFLGMTDEAGDPQPTLELWIFEAEQE